MQRDKIGHFIAGVLIAIIVTLFTGNAQWGFVASIVAGIGKEAVWDGLMGRGTVEVLDAVATIAGGGIVYYALQLGGNHITLLRPSNRVALFIGR